MKTVKVTYISREIDVNGKQMDFERWACKKPETIKNRYARVYRESALFQTLMRINKIERIDIYRTPDGYHAEQEPCYSFDLSSIVPAM